MLRNDLHLPVASTTSGDYWAWVEDFNPMPPVGVATNDVPIVYADGVRPGGDAALDRRYSFEFWAAWETAAGLAALMADITTVGAPRRFGAAVLAFYLGGAVWTLNGRYEPISMSQTAFLV